MIKKTLLALVAGVTLFAGGVMAGGVMDEYLEAKKGEIQASFSQTEQNALSSLMTEVENFRYEDQRRVEKEVEAYRQEVETKTAIMIYDHLMANQYPAETAAITTEHDAAIQEMKNYIDELAEQYNYSYGEVGG